MLTDLQLESFYQNGYLVVDDLLNPNELEAIKTEYAECLDLQCQQWISQNKMDASVANRSFDEQLLASIEAGLDYFQPLDISLPLGPVEETTPIHLGDNVFHMMTNSRLLDAVESLIGPEITSNPIQHVRIKPPFKDVAIGEGRAHIVKTDWHQDRAVALEEADDTRLVTVWLAITDATVSNGCLQVIPGSHKEQMLPHCPLKTQLGIPTALLDSERIKPLPVKAGGAILFHPLTVHSSLENHSNTIRWSFDIRFNATGHPTGRPAFPEFIARSRSAPETELRDAQTWKESWLKTRTRLATERPDLTFYRWDGSHPVCA